MNLEREKLPLENLPTFSDLDLAWKRKAELWLEFKSTDMPLAEFVKRESEISAPIHQVCETFTDPEKYRRRFIELDYPLYVSGHEIDHGKVAKEVAREMGLKEPVISYKLTWYVDKEGDPSQWAWVNIENILEMVGNDKATLIDFFDQYILATMHPSECDQNFNK